MQFYTEYKMHFENKQKVWKCKTKNNYKTPLLSECRKPSYVLLKILKNDYMLSH